MLFCKLCNAVFVGATEEIFTLCGIVHIYVVCEDVHDITQHSLIEIRAGIVLRKDILKCLVLGFDSPHSIIDNRADLRRMGSGGNGAPPGILRHEENILHRIGITVILEPIAFLYKFLIPFSLFVGDIVSPVCFVLFRIFYNFCKVFDVVLQLADGLLCFLSCGGSGSNFLFQFLNETSFVVSLCF